MASFRQQVADVLTNVTGRVIAAVSVSTAEDTLIAGQFQTVEGQLFNFELRSNDGKYTVNEEPVSE